MRNKKKQAHHTIFIACEGSSTEPNYFGMIKEDIEDKEDNIFEIRVYPDDTIKKPITDALGLVAEARKKLNSDEGIDEAWVVFDKDGYTKHKEAFAEAEKEIDGKIVNIAFSSISFEHWVLLHFEKVTQSFLKSQCKCSENKKPIKCGSQQHPNDCLGTKCVAGYLRQNGYLPNYAKQGNIYRSIKHMAGTAFENAAWLRFKQQQALGLPLPDIYTINPYTNVDMLVKRLLNIEETIIWCSSGQTISDIPQMQISINITGGILNFSLVGKNLGGAILSRFSFYVISQNNNKPLLFSPNTPTSTSLPIPIGAVYVKIIYNNFIIMVEL